MVHSFGCATFSFHPRAPEARGVQNGQHPNRKNHGWVIGSPWGGDVVVAELDVFFWLI